MKNQKSEFNLEISGMLDEFKRIHRSNKPNYESANLVLGDFEISRKQMRMYTDAQLRDVIISLIKKMDDLIMSPGSKLYNHSGLREFLDKLSVTLESYTFEKEHAIHVGRTSSRLLLNIVQQLRMMIHQPSEKLESDIVKQITVLKRLQHGETMQQLSTSLSSLSSCNQKLLTKIQKVIGKAFIGTFA